MSTSDEKNNAVDEVSKVDTALPPDPDADLSPEERKKRVGAERASCGQSLTTSGTRFAMED